MKIKSSELFFSLAVGAAVAVSLYCGSVQKKYQALLHQPQTTNTVTLTNWIYIAPFIVIQTNPDPVKVELTNWVMSTVGFTHTNNHWNKMKPLAYKPLTIEEKYYVFSGKREGFIQ